MSERNKADEEPTAAAKSAPGAASAILEPFENRTTPFRLAEVCDALFDVKRALEGAGREVPADLHAEWVAFTVRDDYVDRGDERPVWGTYYGPLGGAPAKDGTWIGVPDITEVTPDVLAHWDRRAREAVHPMLRARYGDVAWDFGQHLKVSVSPDLPRIAIDGTTACAERNLFVFSSAGFRQLNRALSLALSLRDGKRVAAVANAMIAYEEQTAEDRHAGTWGYAFETLVENRPKGVVLPAEVTAKIILDLESRLGRLTQPVEAGKLPEVFAIEAAALALSRYYRKTNQVEDTRRVLTAYGNTFLSASQNVAANLASGWLERVMDVYRDFGLAAEADALAIRIRDLGPQRVQEMKPISASVELPAEEIERFLSAITAGTLEEVLHKIANEFLLRVAQLKKDVERASSIAVVGSMIRREIVDYDGRVVAVVGRVDEDLEGHLALQAAQTMWMLAPFLRQVIDRMRSCLQPSAADLRDHLQKCPMFDPDRGPVIERGLVAYLDGDPIAAVPVLIPQIEHMVRNLLRLSGGSTFKPKRHQNGGLMLKTFDDLLRDPIVISALGEDIIQYFKALFTDQRAWNVRHDTCHGNFPTDAFNMAMADRVFHGMLVLAYRIRAKSVPPTAASQ